MNDPYREGAAMVIDISPEGVTKEERDIFKRAFFECLYQLVKRDPDWADTIKKMSIIVSQGVEQNLTDEEIKETLALRME